MASPLQNIEIWSRPLRVHSRVEAVAVPAGTIDEKVVRATEPKSQTLGFVTWQRRRSFFSNFLLTEPASAAPLARPGTRSRLAPVSHPHPPPAGISISVLDGINRL